MNIISALKLHVFRQLKSPLQALVSGESCNDEFIRRTLIRCPVSGVPRRSSVVESWVVGRQSSIAMFTLA